MNVAWAHSDLWQMPSGLVLSDISGGNKVIPWSFLCPLYRVQLWPGKNTFRQKIWAEEEWAELWEHSWGTSRTSAGRREHCWCEPRDPHCPELAFLNATTEIVLILTGVRKHSEPELLTAMKRGGNKYFWLRNQWLGTSERKLSGCTDLWKLYSHTIQQNPKQEN